MAPILLLINHAFGLPALEALRGGGHLAGVVLPGGRTSDVLTEVRRRAEGARVRLFVVGRGELATALPEITASVGASAGLITAFPWRLPAAAIEAFPLGLYNAHPGLLPAYRGADPVFWQIRRGAASSGVTVHRVECELDAGPIVRVEASPLVSWETHGIHLARLEGLVGPLALQLAEAVATGAPPKVTPQESGPTWSCRRPTPADLAVRWLEDDAPSIQRLANACNGAYDGPITSLGGALWKLLVVTVVPDSGPAASPGTVVRADGRDGLVVACRGGSSLRLDVVATREGTLTGGHLVALGLGAGARFDALPPTAPSSE